MGKEEPEKKTPKERFELVEIPTQLGLAFRDNYNNANLTSDELLLLIANSMTKIEEAIVGRK